jgi:hypothetical protein
MEAKHRVLFLLIAAKKSFLKKTKLNFRSAGWSAKYGRLKNFRRKIKVAQKSVKITLQTGTSSSILDIGK